MTQSEKTHRRASWGETTKFDTTPYGVLRDYADRAKIVTDQAVVLIDSRHMGYRAFHTRDLSTTHGEPTSILHGLLAMASAIASNLRTRHVLFVWDGSVEYKRRIFDGYKIRHDRDRTEEEMADHIKREESFGIAFNALSSLRLPMLQIGCIECDDAIGLLSRRLERIGRDVFVVSDDKDFLQLCTEKTRVFRGAIGQVFDRKSFVSKYGFEPRQFAGWKAIVGESATGDNIPGVPLIADKIATQLIQAHGSLRAIVAAAKEEIRLSKKPRVRTLNLVNANLRRSYRLSKIARNRLDLHRVGFSEDEVAAISKQCTVAVHALLNENREVPIRRVYEVQKRYEFGELLNPRTFAATFGMTLR